MARPLRFEYPYPTSRIVRDYVKVKLRPRRLLPQGRKAAIIGEATADYPGKVILVTEVGGKRFLEPPLGDPLPRIC